MPGRRRAPDAEAELACEVRRPAVADFQGDRLTRDPDRQKRNQGEPDAPVIDMLRERSSGVATDDEISHSLRPCAAAISITRRHGSAARSHEYLA